MSEKKNIDKLFKEQFKDFEVTPDDAIWKNIEKELHKDKRKRRVIPIWWQMAGVAAVLALLFTIGNGIFSDETNATNNSVVDTKSNSDANAAEGQNASTNKKASKNEAIEGAFSTENNTQEVIANTEVTTENSKDGFKTSKGRNASNDNNVAAQKPAENASDKRDFSAENNTQNAIANTKVNADNFNASQAASNEKSHASEATKSEALANVSERKADKTNNGSSSETAGAQQRELQQEKETIKGQPKLPNETIVENQKGSDLKAVPNSESTNPNTPTKIRIAAQVAEENTNQETQLDSLVNQEKNDIETAIAMANEAEDLEKEEEAQHHRWSVSPNVAPVYFNSLGKNGSTLDAQFVNNTKQGDVNVSYGITGSYAINEKLKIRAGMNKVDLGYRTHNVIVFDETNTLGRANQSISNVELNSGNSNYISAKNISFASAPDILYSKEQASLDQNLGFIEVPISIEYSVLDTKFGLNIIGGFSTLFLNANEIYSVEANGTQTLMGKATNVNDLSYSANFGIGVDYKLSKKLKLNLEPTFKYQLNTFSNTSGDFKPFFIGVYTGLSFKF